MCHMVLCQEDHLALFLLAALVQVMEGDVRVPRETARKDVLVGTKLQEDGDLIHSYRKS